MTENGSIYTPVTEKWASVPSFATLNDRELAFLTHAVNGLNNQEIAQRCNVTPTTVDRVLKATRKKISTLDGVGEKILTYSHRQSITPALIENGYFEPVKQD